MNRIDSLFINLRDFKRKAFAAFITAGVPDMDETLKIMKLMDKTGVDIIELGVPFSDPLADGPVIQKSSQLALVNRVNVENVLELVKGYRALGSTAPIILLVYYNTVYQYGESLFVDRAEEAGVDGVIIPDLPYEEAKDTALFKDENIYLIPLAAPTSKERLEKILKESRGFVYCISSKGVTGERKNIETNIKDFMAGIKEKTELPALVGFGVSNQQQVKQLKHYSDGVICGSAIVRRILDNYYDRKMMMESITEFLYTIRKALDE